MSFMSAMKQTTFFVTLVCTQASWLVMRTDDPGTTSMHCGELSESNCKKDCDPDLKFTGCNLAENERCCVCVAPSCTWPLRASASKNVGTSSKVHVALAYTTALVGGFMTALRGSDSGKALHVSLGKRFFWPLLIFLTAVFLQAWIHMYFWFADPFGSTINLALWPKPQLLGQFIPLGALATVALAGLYVRRPLPDGEPQSEITKIRKGTWVLILLSAIELGIWVYVAIEEVGYFNIMSRYAFQEGIYIMGTLFAFGLIMLALQVKAERQARSLLMGTSGLTYQDANDLWKLVHISHVSILVLVSVFSFTHTLYMSLDLPVFGAVVVDLCCACCVLIPPRKDVVSAIFAKGSSNGSVPEDRSLMLNAAQSNE